MPDYEHSAEMAELMTALAAAQATMPNPDCDSMHPQFRTKYASLAAVRDAVTPALAGQGIAVTQLVHTTEQHVSCTTILWHTSGQYLKTTLRLPTAKADAQGYGSTITYARRYSLMALCNVAGDEDDDGEGAVGARSRPEKERRASTQAPAGVHPVTGDVAQDDELRRTLLRDIQRNLAEIVRPLGHTGLFKAVVYHSFGVEPSDLHRQPLETLERGVGLFRHLCDQLAVTGKPPMHPDEWIGIKVRELAANVEELAAEEEGEPVTAARDLWQQEEAAERGEV